MKILLMNSNDKKKRLVLGLTRNCGLVLKNTHKSMAQKKQYNLSFYLFIDIIKLSKL